MSIKIETNASVVAYHVVHGATTFPYATDARSAVSRFPQEWSFEPWTGDAAKAGRQFVKDRHARETAEARARIEAEKAGAPAPLFLDDELEPTPEEQAAIEEHAAAVAEAAERLKARREKIAAEKAEAEQVAADEALVASPPPQPDPNRPRRPFGRVGEPTAAELAQIEKREAKKADDERIAREKANEDKLAGNGPKGTV